MSHLKFRRRNDPSACDVEGERAVKMMEVDGVVQESLTQQSFTQSCDVNDIVRRCGVKDHELPVPPSDPRFYGDVSDMPDLRTALDRMRDARDRFMALPAELRARFHNDPVLLHQFVSDGRNFDEAVKLGLLKAPEEPRRRGGDPVPRRRARDAADDAAELAELRRRSVPPAAGEIAKPSASGEVPR